MEGVREVDSCGVGDDALDLGGGLVGWFGYMGWDGLG